MQNSCRKNSEETCTFWKKKKKKDVCNSHLFHSTEYNSGHEVINSKKSEQKKIGVFIFFLLLYKGLNRISELGKQNCNFTIKKELRFFSSSDSIVCVFVIFMGRRLLTRHFPFTVFVGITIALFLSARRKPN